VSSWVFSKLKGLKPGQGMTGVQVQGKEKAVKGRREERGRAVTSVPIKGETLLFLRESSLSSPLLSV